MCLIYSVLYRVVGKSVKCQFLLLILSMAIRCKVSAGSSILLVWSQDMVVRMYWLIEVTVVSRFVGSQGNVRLAWLVGLLGSRLCRSDDGGLPKWRGWCICLDSCSLSGLHACSIGVDDCGVGIACLWSRLFVESGSQSATDRSHYERPDFKQTWQPSGTPAFWRGRSRLASVAFVNRKWCSEPMFREWLFLFYSLPSWRSHPAGM